MARMIPVDGPLESGDLSRGERSVFALLRDQLSDDFLVIHSLPWLASAVREVDSTYAPTGEIDFLVLHAEFGILALEVKSGYYTVHGSLFAPVGGKKRDVVKQMRHNAHGMARWLGGAGFFHKVGYGWVFPDSDFSPHALPPGFEDRTLGLPYRLVADFADLHRLGEYVGVLMAYWQRALSAPPLGQQRLDQLTELLCRDFDGTPMWGARAQDDARCWLRLTKEQAAVVERVLRGERTLVTGWPGTGKTLIAVELARRLAATGQRVLVVTFNTRLAEHLNDLLPRLGNDSRVTNWHRLCAAASQSLGRRVAVGNDDWLQRQCLADLQDALASSDEWRFDAVLVDEGQALRREWVEVLVKHVSRGTVAVFCDETQRFAFEAGTASLAELQTLVGVERPFVLTCVARMPRAVTEHLVEMQSADHQLTSSRPPHPGSLRELVRESHGSAEDVTRELMSQGLAPDDIVLLTLPAEVKGLRARFSASGMQVESVARFRGLESPAVVVVNAHAMSDAELFCAYSRATTVCVAVYDAESLAWHQQGKFHAHLATREEHRDFLRKTREASTASEIVRRYSGAEMLALHSMTLGWSEDWGGWVAEVQPGQGLRWLWISYLNEELKQPVFYWYAGARRDFFCAQPEGASGSNDALGTLYMAVCSECDEVAPHSVHNGACRRCTGHVGADNEVSSTIFAQLSAADALVQAAQAGTPGWKADPALPLGLHTLCVAHFAQAHARYAVLGLEPVTTGTRAYRSAAACLQAKLVCSSPGSLLVRDEFANGLFPRIHALADLGQANWRAAMANAFSVLQQKGVLTCERRGVYRCPSV